MPKLNLRMTFTLPYKIKLSPYAKLFYTEWLLDPDGRRYNLSIDQTLHGNLEVSRLKKALKKQITEHLILNSHIQNIDGEPCWVKNDHINELEYSNNPAVDTYALLNYVSRGFDLYNEPLYRFKLLQIDNNIYRLILVFHHLLLAGTSVGVGLYQTLSRYYNDKDYTIKYSISNQIKLLSNLADTLTTKLEKNEKTFKNFWQDHLSNVENIDLRFLRPPKREHEIVSEKVKENFIEAIHFTFEEKELAQLNQIKRNYLITEYIYGQCVLAILLNRYTNIKKLAMSYPLAIKEGMDFIYGAQLNTNFITYQIDTDTTVLSLFQQGRNFFKLIKNHDLHYGYYPITKIVQLANKHLLDIHFTQTNLRDTNFEFQGITKVEISTNLYVDSVPKDTILFEQELKRGKLNYRFRYDQRSFDKELANEFVVAFKRLFLEILKDITDRKDKHVHEYNLITLEQYNQIVTLWNQTEKEFPREQTIHQLFVKSRLKKSLME